MKKRTKKLLSLRCGYSREQYGGGGGDVEALNIAGALDVYVAAAGFQDRLGYAGFFVAEYQGDRAIQRQFLDRLAVGVGAGGDRAIERGQFA